MGTILKHVHELSAIPTFWSEWWDVVGLSFIVSNFVLKEFHFLHMVYIGLCEMADCLVELVECEE